MTKTLFVSACLRFLGLPYRWGGDDPMKGFDCSGLVQELLAMLGLDPKGDETAQVLYDYFKSRSHGSMREVGTLYFYGSADNRITHIAMGVDSETVIEAGGGGSKTLTADDAAAQNAYIRLRPWNARKDLVAIIHPLGLPW